MAGVPVPAYQQFWTDKRISLKTEYKDITSKYEWQTWPLIREGAPQRQESNFPTDIFRREIMSGHKPRMGSAPRHTD
jgi:hypothetical protein